MRKAVSRVMGSVESVLRNAVKRTAEENAAISARKETKTRDYQEHYVKLANGVVVCFGFAKNSGGASYELMGIDLDRSRIPPVLGEKSVRLWERWFNHDSVVLRVEDIERGWFGYRYVTAGRHK